MLCAKQIVKMFDDDENKRMQMNLPLYIYFNCLTVACSSRKWRIYNGRESVIWVIGASGFCVDYPSTVWDIRELKISDYIALLFELKESVWIFLTENSSSHEKAVKNIFIVTLSALSHHDLRSVNSEIKKKCVHEFDFVYNSLALWGHTWAAIELMAKRPWLDRAYSTNSHHNSNKAPNQT